MAVMKTTVMEGICGTTENEGCRVKGVHTALWAPRRRLSGSRRTSWFAARRRMWRGNSCMTLRLPPTTGSDTAFIISSSSNARHCTKSTMLISINTNKHYACARLSKLHVKWNTDIHGKPIPPIPTDFISIHIQYSLTPTVLLFHPLLSPQKPVSNPWHPCLYNSQLTKYGLGNVTKKDAN